MSEGKDVGAARPKPIRVKCEGSGQPANVVGIYPCCKMCGREFSTQSAKTAARWGNAFESIPRHMRDDVLAMIDRGDFDDARRLA